MNGNSITDDSTIGDNEVILRRIPKEWVIVDQNLKRKRPTSACFQDGSKDPMSVYILSEAQSPAAVMQGAKEPFLVALPVAFVRKLGLGIIRDPSSGGPGHALLVGKKTGATKEKLAKAAAWVAPYGP